MSWRRAQPHLLNFLAVSSFGILRCAVGFGPSMNDRKSTEMIIESDGKLAFASLKGKSSKHKWKQYNQDSYFYRIIDNFGLFGVCDGHGPKGHNVSHHIAQQISNYVQQSQQTATETVSDPNQWLNSIVSDTIHEIEQRSEIETKRSGSTLVFSYIHNNEENKRILYTTNIGDSRAIICFRHPNFDYMLSSQQLNVEHSPNLAKERNRIYLNGGYIDNRGYVSHSATPYGINMSRSLGDDDIHYNNIVTSNPDIIEYEITSKDVCIVHATDGIWDMMDNSEVSAIISNNLPDLKQAAIDIVTECEFRWRTYAGRVDDITITIFSLKDDLYS